ncbi:DUF1893 domain-containing protein [Ruminococcaceae bacterium OttesenSCG-928-I18]|nr:DUF1893 domain-containing protein [Ruminococcaceae bacterium OttesenSCG-928-I18]
MRGIEDAAALSQKGQGAVEEARAEIRKGEYTCILIKGDQVVYRGEGRGVAPIRRLYEDTNGKKMLQGSILVDKIIGKAAAVLLVLGQVARAHAQTISGEAVRYLEKQGIPFTFEKQVDYIQNRDGDGLCPIEQSVLGIDDPAQAYQAITETIDQLMKKQTP